MRAERMLPRLLLAASCVGQVVVVLALTLLATASSAAGSCVLPSPGKIQGFTSCKYLMVGGGPGGLMAAYWLRRFGSAVCVIEKEDVFGGRMQDYPAPDPNPYDNIPPKEFGTCGLRINVNQPELICLARELNITLEDSPFETVYHTRGKWARSIGDLAAEGVFNVDIPADVLADPESALYEYAMLGTRAAHPFTGITPDAPPESVCTEYPTVARYLRAVLGEEPYNLLQAGNSFRGDFEVPLDVCNYIQFFKVEWDRCCSNYYLVGGYEGMWRVVRQVAAAAGVRFWSSTKATCMFKPSRVVPGGNGSGRYVVTTAGGAGFTAERLVINIPPSYFAEVGGNLGSKLNAAKEIQSVLPIETVVYNAFFPRRFWEETNANGVYTVEPGTNFRVVTDGNCTVRSEYPSHPDIKDTNASRPIYVDQPQCVSEWKAAYEGGGLARVTQLVMDSLRQQFVGVDVPEPSLAYYFNKQVSWHYTKPYTRANYGINCTDIVEWAKHPLQGEDICFVGEAYNLEYSGWVHGAQLSAIKCLQTLFADVLPQEVTAYYSDCGGSATRRRSMRSRARARRMGATRTAGGVDAGSSDATVRPPIGAWRN